MSKQMIFGVNNKGYIKTEVMVSRTKIFFTKENGDKEKFIKETWSQDSFYWNFYETREEVKVVLEKMEEDNFKQQKLLRRNIIIMSGF